MSGAAKAVVKVIEPITKIAKAVNPVVGLALTAVSLYGTYKALKKKPPKVEKPEVEKPEERKKRIVKEEKESFDRQAKYNANLRKESEKDNRIRRSYNHLGYDLNK